MNIYDKRQAFRNGEYKMPPPPMPHVQWSEEQWLTYIDCYGIWNDLEKEPNNG